MSRNAKDIASGAIFVFVGILYGLFAFLRLPFWREPNMGPGYFPMILCGALILMGTVVAIRGFTTAQERPFGIVAWRALLMVPLAIVAFSLTLWPLGVFLASFLTAVIACLSTPTIKPFKMVVTALGIALFCTVIFRYVIKLSVPLFGTLLG